VTNERLDDHGHFDGRGGQGDKMWLPARVKPEITLLGV
jgi:hypothetical protein